MLRAEASCREHPARDATAADAAAVSLRACCAQRCRLADLQRTTSYSWPHLASCASRCVMQARKASELRLSSLSNPRASGNVVGAGLRPAPRRPCRVSLPGCRGAAGWSRVVGLIHPHPTSSIVQSCQLSAFSRSRSCISSHASSLRAASACARAHACNRWHWLLRAVRAGLGQREFHASVWPELVSRPEPFA